MWAVIFVMCKRGSETLEFVLQAQFNRDWARLCKNRFLYL